MSLLISVIIPALNEETGIARTIGSAADAEGVEVIVADGGSADDTMKVAASLGAKIIHAKRGRASQMNAGADAATGDALLFLHADSVLPIGYDRHIRAALTDDSVVAGAFGLRIDSEMRGLRLIERLANWRTRRFSLPYGDQGIFVRRGVFHEVGGFPDTPIMEDFEMMRRLRRRGRVVLAPASVTTSARRWQRHGVVRTTLINQMVIAGYIIGVSPASLRRLYWK